MELSSRQEVTCSMVIESCKLVAFESALAFSVDLSGSVASTGPVQDLC